MQTAGEFDRQLIKLRISALSLKTARHSGRQILRDGKTAFFASIHIGGHANDDHPFHDRRLWGEPVFTD
jgi:hypothetical protein